MRCFACNAMHPSNHDHETGRWYCSTCQTIIDQTIGKSLDFDSLCEILDVKEERIDVLYRRKDTPDLSSL